MRGRQNSAEEIKAEVLAFCREEELLPGGGGRILCAVSGGADSMCMLHMFAGLRGGGLEPVCAHFNHRLRGAESDRDESFVRGFCAERKIPFFGGGEDVLAWAAENKRGVEDSARVLRYRFLERAAAKSGACRILTAHTADDNLETMLLNLVRGSGLRGLCGIPPRRGDIIRPLLTLTRAKVERYLTAVGAGYVTDSTNDSEDYSRNRLRKTVLPVLRQLNAQAAENAARAALLMRRDEEFLERAAADFIEGNAAGDALPIDPLLALPEPVSSRVLRQMTGAGTGAGHIDAVKRLCRAPSPSGRLYLPGLELRREYGYLVFGPAKDVKIGQRPLSPGDNFELFRGGPRLRCETIEKCPDINTSFNIFYFQSDSICGKIYVRSYLPGDKIRFCGRNCTKTLRKLFAEKKIPRYKRGEIPVFADEAGVIAVAGFGTAQRCAPVPGKSAVKVEIWERA